MATDPWARIITSSSSSRRHASRFGEVFLGFEDVDSGEDELNAEYPCPFCPEDFDLVGLCCHIDDEHPVEVKTGICPVCMERVGMDLVGHLTSQHRSFFKMQQKRRKSRRGTRKETFQSLFGGSGYANLQPNASPDPLLSSFISNLPAINLSKDIKSEPLDERDLDSESLEETVIQRVEPSIPVEEQEERGRRSQFAQGLVLSTIFDEDDFL